MARNPHPEPPTDQPSRRPGRGRRLGGLVLVVALLVGAGAVAQWRGWLPQLDNPFAEQTTDRSQPVLLKSIQDLSRFTAASGNFEVVIDVQTTRRFVPEFLFEERTLLVAAGSVDAYVEFGGLTEGALAVDEQAGTVAVTLPPPQLAPPNIDLERSYVYSEERGIANRISDLLSGDPDQERQILRLAEERIGEAAEGSGLRERAEENTRKLLEGMLGSLGYEVVTVTFAAP